MRLDGQRMAGSASRLAPDLRSSCCVSALIVTLAMIFGPGLSADAQELYKYRGENGEWIYADRPPDDEQTVEVRELNETVSEAGVTVTDIFVDSSVELVAQNRFYAPVELRIKINSIRGLEFPASDLDLKWVLRPRSTTQLLRLDLLQSGAAPHLEYQFEYLLGQPGAQHRPTQPYRAPFAISKDHPVTQAFPQVVTHTTPDSYFAIDVAMPIGTDIFAARAGIVFDVAANNFQGGLDPVRDGPSANVVRILHDDGTYALYAHLNWNSIRVKPGARVQRGEYIADSGNTGFSSGPHLHFAVLRNAGEWMESIPIEFLGANLDGIVPAAGSVLTAY